MMKKICLFTAVCLQLLFLTGCGGSRLAGVWLSDYDRETGLVFEKDSSFCVRDGNCDVLIFGKYDVRGTQITFRPETEGSGETMTVFFEIEKDKLRLINTGGQTEQFSRK